MSATSTPLPSLRTPRGLTGRSWRILSTSPRKTARNLMRHCRNLGCTRSTWRESECGRWWCVQTDIMPCSLSSSCNNNLRATMSLRRKHMLTSLKLPYGHWTNTYDDSLKSCDCRCPVALPRCSPNSGALPRRKFSTSVEEPTVMSFTVLLTGSTIVATAVVTTCSSPANYADSLTSTCSGSVCIVMPCGGGSFNLEGAYDSLWDSVKPMTGSAATTEFASTTSSGSS